MAIRKSSEAINAAKAQTRNTPGMCQAVTRGWFNAPAVGDVDGDGDADAVDGWKSEPAKAKHPGDRNPPPGKPLSFSGGSNGHGHRCISLYKGLRSTDIASGKYRAGYTGSIMDITTSAAIAQLERTMGVKYLGWSDTIDGHAIPPEVANKPVPVPVPPAPAKPAAVPKNLLLETRIASLNLMSLPKNPNIANAIKSVNTIAFVGIQEADQKSFKVALKKRWPGIIQLGDLNDVTYAAPMVARQDLFKTIKSGTRIIHKGAAGISYTRRLTWAIEEKDNAPETKVGIINLHAVLCKKDDKYQQRLKMRAQNKVVLKKQVDEFQKLGLPIIITGDFNDTANWLGANYGGQKVQRVIHKVDQILLVDSPKRYWKFLSSNHADNSSDHDVLRAKAQLFSR